MGLGAFGGGADSARFASNQGGIVTITDLKKPDQLQNTIDSLSDINVQWHLGEHLEEDFVSADILIVNPAVPPNNHYIQIAREAGAIITSQMQIFFELCPAKIIGITGSNGKSTTTALTYHLLNAGSKQDSIEYNRVFLSGNIGHKPLLGLIDEIHKDDLVVLEISNFQLEQLAQTNMGPTIALITNLSPNHLDRHGTFEEYCRVKEGIFLYQSLDDEYPAVSIFNTIDPICMKLYDKFNGQQGRICKQFREEDVPESIKKEFSLPGKVNLQNLSAALAITSLFNIDLKVLEQAVSTFQGLENRMEFVAEINGICWYDDSKATTPISTMAALNGMEEPKIVIVGGYDKGINFDELGKCIAKRAKAVVLIGQTAGLIGKAVAKSGSSDVIIKNASSMEEAVNICSKLSQKGGIVLMSPACASYDMFKNYQERSSAYKKAVGNLQNEKL